MFIRHNQTDFISTRRVGLLIPENEVLELVVHEFQLKKNIRAKSIYGLIKAEGTLNLCLSQRDGEEIAKLSQFEFVSNFGKVNLMLWRSDICNDPVNPKVPVLRVDAGRRTEIIFVDMDFFLGRDHITPRIFRDPRQK